MAMNRLRVGMGCNYALAIGEKSCGQFLGKPMSFFGGNVILSVAGQLEVIIFPFVIFFALVKSPHCFRELLGVVLVLKEILNGNIRRLFGIGNVLHYRARRAFARLCFE